MSGPARHPPGALAPVRPSSQRAFVTVTRNNALQLLALEVVLRRALEALATDSNDRAAETELR